jgi:hypothetical protein
MDCVPSLKTAEQCVSDKTNIPSEPYITSPSNKLKIKYEGQKADQTLMMGTQMVPQMSVIFNQLTWLIAKENFINICMFSVVYYLV